MTAVATREYAFPVLASLPDATLTALTQITVNLPEDGKTFTSVTARITANDIITATGGTVAQRRVDLSVNGATATVVNSVQSTAHTGENMSLDWECEFTAHFAANWGVATSRTVDVSVLIDQNTGTTLGWVNVCVTLLITYEYDEASAAVVKTVWVPLNAPVGALATSKPGAPTDTVPALDTYCPEANKVFRQINIVVQGNTAHNGAATDSTISIEIDSAGAQTTGIHEGALSSDRWVRYVFQGQSWDTSVAHSFYLWGSVARYNHLQVYMVVTYEYDPASTTDVLNSVWLPASAGMIMGGLTSADYHSAVADLWIEEPGTISNARIAAYLFWTQTGVITGLNARLGTGSFVSYTDAGITFCGGSGLMVRNDAAFTLARGRNTLNLDIYSTDSADRGWGLNGLFLVCYTSDVPSGGAHLANKSVLFDVNVTGSAAYALPHVVDLAPPNLLHTAYFVQGAWVYAIFCANLSLLSASVALVDNAARATRPPVPHGTYFTQGDTERGSFITTLAIHPRQWPEGLSDIDIEVGNVRVLVLSAVATPRDLGYWVTYHGNTFAAAGAVYGAVTGTVTLTLHRAADGHPLMSTTRSGSGAFSFDWYDDTEDVYVSCVDNAGRAGRSRAGLAGIDTFDIVLGRPLVRSV